MFVVILALSAYLGYRLCILNQHQTEVPRVVLNQVRARIRAITAPSSRVAPAVRQCGPTC